MNPINFRGHGLLYLNTPENHNYEAQLIDILTKLEISSKIARNVVDLVNHKKGNERIGLVVTDISNLAGEFQSIVKNYPTAYIISINEEAVTKKGAKGVCFIKAFPTFYKAMDYLKSGTKQSGEFGSRVYINSEQTEAHETSKEEGIEQEDISVHAETVNESVESLNVSEDKQTTSSPTEVQEENLKSELPLPTEQTEEKGNRTEEIVEPPIIKKEINSEDQEDGSVQYQENAYFKRSRNLQKQLFSKQKWEENRMIGIWSPLHRTGVTSLTMDFAFYLAQNRIYTAVLEGLTEQHALKDRLKRFTNVPNKWESYARAIQTDSVANHSEWKYRNVTFLPLDKEDSKYEWNSMSLETYMTTTKIVDVTLVDLPTGKMASYTTDTLHYLDELWIVVDDAIQETLAWKSYIREIERSVGIPISLIFNKAFPFSQIKRMGKEMSLPVIATMPSLHEETMKNYYENTPLYFQTNVQEKVSDSYFALATHLFDGKFEVAQQMLEPKANHWFEIILKPLKG